MMVYLISWGQVAGLLWWVGCGRVGEMAIKKSGLEAYVKPKTLSTGDLVFLDPHAKREYGPIVPWHVTVRSTIARKH